MKKMWLLSLALSIVLLCTAMAEDECPHMVVEEMATSHTVIEARAEGHYSCRVINSMCLDCKMEFVDYQYDGFTGHTFHMAESIHGHQDGVHLWVMICKECKYVTMLEELCEGDKGCYKYHAQEGTHPAIQHVDSLAPWKVEESINDIVKHWIEEHRELLKRER